MVTLGLTQLGDVPLYCPCHVMEKHVLCQLSYSEVLLAMPKSILSFDFYIYINTVTFDLRGPYYESSNCSCVKLVCTRVST